MTTTLAPSTRTFTVTAKGTDRSVQSELTDAAAYQTCSQLRNRFAQDLTMKPLRLLSAKQIAWLHVLVIEARPAPQTAAPARPAPAADLLGIVDLLGKARMLKLPRLRLALGGKPVHFGLCGNSSRTPGAVRVTNGVPYGEWGAEYYGTITKDGVFQPSRQTPPDGFNALLRRLAAAPAEVAAEHGKLTGNCGFCDRPLTDPRSVEAGYGKICSERYGLPY